MYEAAHMYGAYLYVHTLTCERGFIRVKSNEHKHDDTLLTMSGT